MMADGHEPQLGHPRDCILRVMTAWRGEFPAACSSKPVPEAAWIFPRLDALNPFRFNPLSARHEARTGHSGTADARIRDVTKRVDGRCRTKPRAMGLLSLDRGCLRLGRMALDINPVAPRADRILKRLGRPGNQLEGAIGQKS